MGTRYLTELANWCREAGLNVVEYDGWKTRARSSGGFDDGKPLCIMWHHTASPKYSAVQNEAFFIAQGSNVAPVANLFLTRDGTVYVIAAGATNTNGKGQSMVFSRGTVPKDQMNTNALGIEAANDGVGEPWSERMIDAYFKLNNKLTEKLGLRPSDLSSHQAYAPDRKIDPAQAGVVQGPWKPRSINTYGSWSLNDMRAEAENRAVVIPPPEPEPDLPPPVPGPLPPPKDDDMNADVTERLNEMGLVTMLLSYPTNRIGWKDQAESVRPWDEVSDYDPPHKQEV